MKLTFSTLIFLDCENESEGKRIIESVIKYQGLFVDSRSIDIEFVRTINGYYSPKNEKSLVQRMNEKLDEKGENK